MFAPTGPTGNGGPMNPHYVHGTEQLVGFLEKRGVTSDVAMCIASDLQTLPSVSVRTALPQSAVTRYTLLFKPTCIREDSGASRLLKTDVIGNPTSDGNRWIGRFHELDQFLNALENVLDLPSPQLTSIRQTLLSGGDCELGGRVSGVARVVGEEQLMQLGLVEEEPESNTC